MVRVVGAHADLDGVRRVDDSLFGRVEKHGAVVDASLAVFPGIRVRVEVDQGQRPVFFVQCPQHRIADEMVAPQGQRHCAVRDDAAIGLGDFIRHPMRTPRIETYVPPVDHVESFARIELPCVGRAPGQRCGGRAYRARTQARAGAIGRGQVERHANHGDIGTCKVLGVAAAQEAQGAGVGRFGNSAVRREARECLVDDSVRGILRGMAHGDSMVAQSRRSPGRG